MVASVAQSKAQRAQGQSARSKPTKPQRSQPRPSPSAIHAIVAGSTPAQRPYKPSPAPFPFATPFPQAPQPRPPGDKAPRAAGKPFAGLTELLRRNQAFKKRLNVEVRAKFALRYTQTHPCEHQHKECLDPTNCGLRGLPVDACLLFLQGSCGFGESCQYRHYDKLKPSYSEAIRATLRWWIATSTATASCPCEFVHAQCRYGNKCLWRGAPLDTCVQFLAGTCREEACRLQHPVELAARVKALDDYMRLLQLDESWLAQYSRVCPRCGSAVEKLQGCPHMTCWQCRCEFDWNDMATAVGGSAGKVLKEAVKRLREALFDERGPYQLFVLNVTGQTVSVTVPGAHCDVQVVLDLVAARTSVPAQHQRLLFGGKQLTPGLTLAQFNVQRGSTLHLVLRLPGGEH